MNIADKDFNWLIDALSSIERLPGVALVAFSSIVFGYVLRYIKKFPNGGIPVAVVMWGVIWTWMLAPIRLASDPALAWRSRQALVGIIVGWTAWQIHSRLLKRFEDKIPFLRDLLRDEAAISNDPPAPAPAPTAVVKP